MQARFAWTCCYIPDAGVRALAYDCEQVILLRDRARGARLFTHRLRRVGVHQRGLDDKRFSVVLSIVILVCCERGAVGSPR